MAGRVEVATGAKGGRALKLDVYQPEGEARAILVMVHGGGWRGGSTQGVAAYGELFARLGFLTIAGEYRLLPEAPWPAQLDDVKAVVAWVTEKAADLGAPSGRTALLGFSAGGHLALLAADDLKDQVAAVVALFAPTELVAAPSDPHHTPASKLLDDAANDSAARLASPLHRAGPDFPPTFLIHGADDPVVPPITSQRMYDALIAAGVKAELHIYAGHTHEFADAPYMMELMAAEVANFLYRIVIDPAGARREDQTYNAFARQPQA